LGLLLSNDYEYIEIKEREKASSTSLWAAIICLILVFVMVMGYLFKQEPRKNQPDNSDTRLTSHSRGVEIQMTTFESDFYLAEKKPNPHFISSSLESPLLIPKK
jgi:hypothetical protein